MIETCGRQIATWSKTMVVTTFFALIFFQMCSVSHSLISEKGKPALYLVSVGVGDPDLITVRAINTIKKSDVIVCREKTKKRFAEYLKEKEFLDISLSGWRTYGRDCSRIEGKEKRITCEQNSEKRAKLIFGIRSAIAAGKTVAVLGSGDLLIYGGPYRWYLEEFADLNPRIIPGVSCFNAANAALRKDVALGKETHAVVLTTVREIEKLSKHHPTMVIFTMHTKFKDLVEKLQNLYPLQTPIAVVVYAGYKEKERLIKGRLNTILELVGDEKFPFEHLVYVGDFLDQKRKKER
jgi:precorrin-4/cobalt-precorrin-4 C11-methyltransferase